MTTLPFQLAEGSFDDWYVLEDLLGRTVSDACVEGTAEEWLAIAGAIERRESISFKRCRAHLVAGGYEFDSPRNTQGRAAKMTLAAASALAFQIRGLIKFAPASATRPKASELERLRAGVAALRSLVVADSQFSRADVVRILNDMLEAT